ncbi:MAG: hypothetical protein ACRDZU_09280 [Acidimicrobiales bacterium]
MSSKRIVGALLLLVIGAGMGLGVAAMVGDDDDEPTGADLPVETTTTVERPDESQNPEAAELYDLVTAFTGLTLHASYRVEVADRPEATSTIEIWQKEGQVRQEATVEAGAGAGGKIALLDLVDRVVLCQQPPGGDYSCGLVSEEEATAFDSLRTNLIADLADQDVEVRNDTIDGREVRCFSIAVAEASEICVSDEGVLTRIASPEGSFELIEFDTEVDDDVFTPPATPGTAAVPAPAS